MTPPTAPPTSREELLGAYAAGAASPGLTLLCAAHLILSSSARTIVAAAEELSGALLAEEPAADPPPSFETMLARLDDEPETAIEPRIFDSGGLPAAIIAAVGRDFGEIPWRWRSNRISECALQDFLPEKVSLIRGRPGARTPRHTHSGFEATLVLAGALRDQDQVMRPGDLALCGPDHHHQPEVVGDEICYCLVVVDGSLRFTGAWGPALNLFTD